MKLDYDLEACLQYNNIGISAHEISDVLAVWEGENDGDDWRWVIKTTNERFAPTHYDELMRRYSTPTDSPEPGEVSGE